MADEVSVVRYVRVEQVHMKYPHKGIINLFSTTRIDRMRVLGIETSCDETGIAVFEGGRGLLAQAVYSQTELHARYGGVVPELASRDHIRKLLPLIRQVLAEAELEATSIGGVAYTAGPGLAGALLVGASFGRSLAWAWGVPAIGVHHMEGHLLAPMLEDPAPAFPFVALLVSGGHTQLVEVTAVGVYRVLGESLDDAAGEAFDKTAKNSRFVLPGRAGAGKNWPKQGGRGSLSISAADGRSTGPGFQLQRAQDTHDECIARGIASAG